MQTTFYNVGHGEAIFIDLGNRRGIVRDFGRSRFAKHTDFSVSIPRILSCDCCRFYPWYLLKHYPHCKQSDAILTHAHEDHFNGFRELYNQGLNMPEYDLTEGYFRVTLKGPGDDLDRLRPPSDGVAGISPAVADQLSKRQVSILEHAVKEGKVTTGWVTSALSVVKDTAVRDLKCLCDLNLLSKQGKGRGVHYVPATG
jgi:ribonuclease BN (tRNA processing enzyme)